jgi:hypothetical protein
VAVSGELIARLGSDPAFEARKVPNGTSVFFLRPRQADPERMRLRLAGERITLPPPRDGAFWPRVNETLASAGAGTLAEAFHKAAAP